MKFKNGQRVAIICPAFIGITGTIIDVRFEPSFGLKALVKIDEKYHSSLRSKGCSFDLNISLKYLRLLPRRTDVE